MSKAARLAALFSERYGNADSVDSVDSPLSLAKDTIDTIGIEGRPKNEAQRRNNEGASNAAFEAAERAAIVAEGEFGNAAAPVPHFLPPSWGDARIEPTPGAVCYSCRRRNWWCEAVNPSGWRCGVCHPPPPTSAGTFRRVET